MQGVSAIRIKFDIILWRRKPVNVDCDVTNRYCIQSTSMLLFMGVMLNMIESTMGQLETILKDLGALQFPKILKDKKQMYTATYHQSIQLRYYASSTQATPQKSDERK